jgi:hypothetical protein
MSRPQEQAEAQVELEEDVVSGIGEADEVMEEVEEGYSEFCFHANFCVIWSQLMAHQHHLPPHLRSHGSAGSVLYPAMSTFVKCLRILSKMISTLLV